ncbi:protein shisa-4-like isoform X2 [Bombus pascuorum]|uniref:protein shisa-4-like isoform X2 n=1 Tax=Bombus pascuorum TaxID=65598 RepID=UPI00298E1DBF|nr:protein shisa-4-like isoform X2 [Bombus pascuorum]
MSRVTTTLFLLIGINTALCYGMECTFGNKNFISRAINSCPGLLDPEERSYCCYNMPNESVYCCDAMEFTLQSSWLALIIVTLSVIVFTTVVCCISCLCCNCCPWYRRRHQGTVYGIQVPSVVHVIRPSTIIPQPTPQYINIACPTNSAGISQPPIYSAVIYEKQAPYNPNYPNMSSTQQ